MRTKHWALVIIGLVVFAEIYAGIGNRASASRGYSPYPAPDEPPGIGVQMTGFGAQGSGNGQTTDDEQQPTGVDRTKREEGRWGNEMETATPPVIVLPLETPTPMAVSTPR